MKDTNFTYTADGSVGLYDEKTKDIYHSVTGALTESFDKFIFATDYEKFCSENKKVKVLDICFGIGYNTKAAIYSAIKKNFENEIEIYALELFPQIAYLAPFINDGLNNPGINLYILAVFIYKFSDFSEYIEQFFSNETQTTSKYFNSDICLVFKKYLSERYHYKEFDELLLFLHNIYYQNISNSMENDLNVSKYANFEFNIIFGDARKTINYIKDGVNFLFLDAFTPHKQPLLWTYEFLSLVKSKMDNNSILSTYSNALPIRKSLKDLGFYIGKIILDGKQFGTTASFDISKIKNPLSKYDEGMLMTKSALPYHDCADLNLTSAQILEKREKESKQCDIMSTADYKRMFENDCQL